MEIRSWMTATGELQLVFAERQHDGKWRAFNPCTQQSYVGTAQEPLPDEFILKFSVFDRHDLANAFRKFADEHGAKRPDRDYIEGELKATRAHLEDMRTLALNNIQQNNHAV